MYFKSLITIILFVFNLHSSFCDDNNLKIFAKFKYVEFKYPTPWDKYIAEITGTYVQGNGVPLDIQPFYNKTTNQTTVFMTIPRFVTDGIVATLVTISQTEFGPSGPLLVPYPNYTWHKKDVKNCEKISSVFRVAIDPCNQLWVLDTGTIAGSQSCPPQILIFDLHTDKLIHRYRIPNGQYLPFNNYFFTIIVDVPDTRNKCKCAKAYLADGLGNSIVVYDYKTDSSYRVQNELFYPCPGHGKMAVAGETFIEMVGVAGLAINIINGTDRRGLYFNPMSSLSQGVVDLSIINNRTLWSTSPIPLYENIPQFKIIGNRASQVLPTPFDRNRNMFFGYITKESLACWNLQKPFNTDNIRILSKNVETMQVISGMKIGRNAAGKDQLWLVSDRMQRIKNKTFNKNEFNYYILYADTEDLLGGATC